MEAKTKMFTRVKTLKSKKEEAYDNFSMELDVKKKEKNIILYIWQFRERERPREVWIFFSFGNFG